MVNVNQNRLEKVVNSALDKVKGNRRWESAINKAQRHIEENPYIHFENGYLLVLSDSGMIYEVKDNCQCKAAAGGFPCWHRAAKRLLQRYTEVISH